MPIIHRSSPGASRALLAAAWGATAGIAGCDMFHVEGWRFAIDIAWCLLSAFCAIFNAVTVNDDDPPRKFAP